jgi:hypothetical protein
MTGGYDELRMWAEMFADIDQEYTRQSNRVGVNGDGEIVRPLNVDAGPYIVHLQALKALRHQIGLDLVRCYRKTVPPSVIAWQRAEKGVGEHLMARLLGHLGPVDVATPKAWADNQAFDPSKPSSRTDNPKRVLIDQEPYRRSVSQLWAYCGVGDPTRKKRTGMSQEDAFKLGNPRLRTILWLIVDHVCMEPGRDIKELMASEDFGLGWVSDAKRRYRRIYEERRAETVKREHAGPCVRCGPSGKPAPDGSPWSKGHQHADALRIVGKEILRDLWLAAEATGG